jgi:DNA polymerase V
MKAIVDCNSFYCSCERVFRPELSNKPVVVLSNNDGCIISRSDEAKALGVDMTGPYFMAKTLIEQHKVEVFSSNYNLYGDLSWRVMSILEETVGKENVEVYSVDEAFLNLENFSNQQLQSLGGYLRDTIELWTGIKVSIGIAPTKTLSKLANKIAKDQKQLSKGVMLLYSEEMISNVLKTTQVETIWGIGGQYKHKLKELGIDTAWHLRNLPENTARRHLGGVVGVRLVKELRGEPCIEMNQELDRKKMIATTRMFGSVVTNVCDLKEAVASYTARAGEKLRRQQSAASVISTFLVAQEKVDGPHFKHGPTVSTYTTLAIPTSLTNELIKPAVAMVDKLFCEGKKYKKAGVILSGLVPDDSAQGNLFQERKSVGCYLMEMMDNINFSMRGDVVKFAATGTTRDWKMRRQFHSPRYTTRWDELCPVY